MGFWGVRRDAEQLNLTPAKRDQLVEEQGSHKLPGLIEQAGSLRGASSSLYDRAGKEEGVRRLVDVFYDIIEQEPEGDLLRLLHLRGHGIAHSRLEQFNFLSGFLGGPKLYPEKHGHSDVRKMHAHVEVDPQARDAWLNCMSMALDRLEIDADTKSALLGHFRVVARMLKNRD